MHKLYLIILLLVAIPSTLSAQREQHDKREIEALLLELDSAIANKMTYQAMRQSRADSLEKEVAASKDPKEYVNACKALYGALCDFDGKRSLDALYLLEKTEAYNTDSRLRTWVMLNQARVYATMGLYHRANDIINNIDPRKLVKDDRLEYYHTCRSVFEKISDYISDSRVAQVEATRMTSYFDSILALQPAGIGRDITVANKNLYLHRPHEAWETLQHDLPKAQGKEYLYLCVAMADIYRQQNDRQNQMYYLAITSIDDIKNGTTEYAALPHLISNLYEEDDIERAYRYLMCAMEDANFYPARNLAVEVSKNFPLINKTYSSQQAFLVNAEKMKRSSLAITYGLLALTICVTFYLGWRHYNSQEQRKRTVELQKALDQATIADRVKTVFIQNMRHEIRTPLNAIMGFAQLMTNDLSDEERTLYISYIMESNNHLLSTLDNIIDVSNMEVGIFNFKFDQIDLDELCQSKIAENKGRQPAGVNLLYQPSQKGLQLYTDKKRVGQVLNNLLSNACKNTVAGTIILSVSYDTVNDTAQFIVTDTGKGIPLDKTDLIFQHFEKIDHYSPGLGLGLYVGRLIAHALGGEIYLDTSYTDGAKFVFTVPNARKPKIEK